MPRKLTPQALQTRLVYVATQDRVWDKRTRRFLTLPAAQRHYSSSYGGLAEARYAMMDGEFALPKAIDVTFRPGQPELIQRDGDLVLNLYRGRDITRAPGDAGPFVDHITLLVDGNEEAGAFLLDFIASLVQSPERKMAFAVLIIGGQGIGKSILGEFLAELVGPHNVCHATNSMLTSDFSDWMRDVHVIVVEELADTQRSSAARLKDLITGKRIYINPKGRTGYEIDNYMNFIMFTNDTNAAKLDADDRRYFVWHCHAVPQLPEYYQKLTSWFDGIGKRHVLDFLLKRDLRDFHRHKAPPRTQAREALIHESRADWEQYLLDAFEAGDVPFDIDLCVVSHVIDYYRATARLTLTTRQVTAFLRDHLKATFLGQRRIRDGDRKVSKPRMWAIREGERWAKATEAETNANYVKPSATRQPMRAAAPSDLAPQPRRLMAPQSLASNDEAGGPANEAQPRDLARH